MNRIAVKLRRSSDPFPADAAVRTALGNFLETARPIGKRLREGRERERERERENSRATDTSDCRVPPAFPRNRQENSRTIDSTERIGRSIRPTAASRNAGCLSRQRVYKANTTGRTCAARLLLGSLRIPCVLLLSLLDANVNVNALHDWNFCSYRCISSSSTFTMLEYVTEMIRIKG